jgi:hypothetical protein
MLRQLVTGAALLLILIFGYLLRQAASTTPLLGLWDTGRYEHRPLQPLPEMKAPPADAQLVLNLDTNDVRVTRTLGELFDRYGLDNSLLRPTILASDLPAPKENDTIADWRNRPLHAPVQIKVPLQEPAK